MTFRRIIALIALTIPLLAGCCVHVVTSVRNETGGDIQLTEIRHSQPIAVVTIHPSSSVTCAGILPTLPGEQPESWIISDGEFRFTFADVSLIATMPHPFRSSSRFTRDFPCNRITKHVRITHDMAIHAARVIGYTESEPPSFPIRYTNKERER